MPNPLVSIIVPAYNVAGYIAESLDSALTQTYRNIEIIVVDDGSTDGTRSAVEPYLRDARIRYIYQANKGLSGARNTAIRESHGEYVALLDSDDLFLPRKIERQVAYMEAHPACDISYCDLYHFNDGGDAMMKLQYEYYSGSDVLPHLVRGNFIAPLAVVMRRSVFERFGYFDESLRRSEDIEFWIRVASGGGTIGFVPEILGRLRIRTVGNLQDTKSQPLMKRIHYEVLEKLWSRISPAERERLSLRRCLFLYAMKTAVAYLVNGERAEARVMARRAAALYPAWGFLLYVFFAAVSCVMPVRFAQFLMHRHYAAKRLRVLLPV